MTGKITLVGCGGAGINISIKAYEQLRNLGDGYSEVDIELIDTSDKTIQAYSEYKDKFTRIISSKLTGKTIDGAGGERKSLDLLKEVTGNIKNYLDKRNFENESNNYYVIIASASGGSGSMISPVLTSLLLARDYNVIVVNVGDSSNILNLNNTIATLTSFQSVAIKNKAALSMIYYNNTVDNNTTPANEEYVNGKIFSMLSIISLYCGGMITNLDHIDMNNFFRPSKYKTFNVEPGIYSLGISKGTLSDENTLLARTIVKDESSPFKVDVVLSHNKTGKIPSILENSFDEYPVYLLFRKDILHKEVVGLKELLKSMEDANRNKYNAFSELDNSLVDEDDDLGIIL